MDMSSAGAMAIDTKKKKKKRRRRSNSKAQGEEGTSQPTQESIEATKRKRREPTDRFCLSAQLHSQTENSKCTEDETQRGIRIEPAKSQQSASKPSSVLDKMRARLSGGHFRMLNEKLYTCRGWLLVAEVKSRFDPGNGGADPHKFVKALQSIGFVVVSKDLSNKMFMLFYFRKEKEKISEGKHIDWPKLKPCIYKRR